jgi:hypothetical protein
MMFRGLCHEQLVVLTGICMKVPVVALTVGYEYSGTTGTELFFINIGPCIGVTGIKRFCESETKKQIGH